jgi:catechol 2,3-dioxygenase-like lactoylglutathione lyase family enzyme
MIPDRERLTQAGLAPLRVGCYFPGSTASPHPLFPPPLNPGQIMPNRASRSAENGPSHPAVLALFALGLTLGACSSTDPTDLQARSPDAAAREAVAAASFHHVHLNVTDPQGTVDFYEKFFGALPIQYRDRSPALFTERSFILLNEVATPPRSNLGTTIWHIGWAGVDGATEFDWRTREGIEVQTPITRLGPINDYMYFWGPDREVVEVWTGSRNHRFEHVHLIASDVYETISWFAEHFGLSPTRPVEPGVRGSTIRVDNVNIIVWVNPMGGPDPNPAQLPPEIGPDVGVTDGAVIDHIAFSYPDIAPVHARMVDAGVQIVRGIESSERDGHTSFFVRGPDGLLVEVVQEKPIPEGLWR